MSVKTIIATVSQMGVRQGELLFPYIIAQGESSDQYVPLSNLTEALNGEQLRAHVGSLASPLWQESAFKMQICAPIEVASSPTYSIDTARIPAEILIQDLVRLVMNGSISKEEAISSVSTYMLESLLHPRLSPAADARPIASGISASPGGASGIAVFDASRAVELAAQDVNVILIRPATEQPDVPGICAADGVLTATGGKTSHAAVIAREASIPCVVGCGEVVFWEGEVTIGGVVVNEGDAISLNATTGEVFLGRERVIAPSNELSGDVQTLLEWADEIAQLEVWANADSAAAAKKAIALGAKGIGVCRTEHMFRECLELFVEIIKLLHFSEASKNEGTLNTKIEELGIRQKEDFKGIFREMNGRPVTIRLLDPPLHEFLPSRDNLIKEVTKLQLKTPLDITALKNKQEELNILNVLHEANPMLGLRGCRLGIRFPQIYEMQVRAILEAANEVQAEGIPVLPGIMIPNVSIPGELKIMHDLVTRVAKEVMSCGATVDYKFGSMIELPSACLAADKLVEHGAEFFSFGTNDLTQFTYGASRDDGRYLGYYQEAGIYPSDPFDILDAEGVVPLMRIAIQDGRRIMPKLIVGICGEHGGEPESIRQCHNLGLTYASCSSPRVPIARLAAAHAAL